MAAGPTRRTQGERRDEAERRMLEAGVRLVAKGGLEALRLADVGVEAGYSRGLPTHHFGTKANFERVLLGFIRDEYSREMAASQRARGLEGLIALIRGFCDVSKDSLCLCVVTLVLSDPTPGQPVEIEQLRAASFGAVEQHVVEGIERGEIRPEVDPRRLALLVVAAVNGALKQWLVDRQLDLSLVGDELTQLLLSGVSVTRPRSSPRG